MNANDIAEMQPTAETIAREGRARAGETVIEASGRWLTIDIKEAWEYRELLWVLAARDIKVRYKQTVLGVAWAILRPLTATLLFSIVFGVMAKLPSDGMPYPLFSFVAMVPWTFFATAVSAAGQSLIGSAHLVSKVYFPRLFIPLSAICTSAVDFCVSLSLLFAMLAWYRVQLTSQVLLLPLLAAFMIVTTIGVGTLLAALTVSYRDFTHITPFLVQVWTYATPVVFSINMVPTQWRLLAFANPMTGVVEAFRAALLGTQFDSGGVALSCGVATLLLIVGVINFERVQRRFADVI